MIRRADDTQSTHIMATWESPTGGSIQRERNTGAKFDLKISMGTCLARNTSRKYFSAAPRSEPMQCRIPNCRDRLVCRFSACIDEFALSIARLPHGHSSEDLIKTSVRQSQVFGIINVQVLKDLALECIACVAGVEEDGQGGF